MIDPYNAIASVRKQDKVDDRKYATRAPAHKEGIQSTYTPQNAKQSTPSVGRLGIRGTTDGK